MAERIGFLGTGLMGMPMALNLIKAGYPVTVWNRTADKVASAVRAGAMAVNSPAELNAAIRRRDDVPDQRHGIRSGCVRARWPCDSNRVASAY